MTARTTATTTAKTTARTTHDGATGVSGPVYPVDSLTDIAVAYGFRKLSESQQYAVKVRRSSDDTTQDIGFGEDNLLDETALLAFTGAADGFVDTFYDQSGNSRNLTASVTARQPKIVNSGAVLKVGNAVRCDFDGTDDCLFTSAFDLSGTTIASAIIGVVSTVNTPLNMLAEFGTAVTSGGFDFTLNNSTNGVFGAGIGVASNYVFNNARGPLGASKTFVGGANFDVSLDASSKRAKVRQNGDYCITSVAASAGTPTTGAFANRQLFIGARNNASSRFAGQFTGFILRSVGSTEAEFATMEQWLMQDMGIAYQHKATVETQDYTAANDAATYGFNQPAAFAEAQFTTSATEFFVNSENTTYTSFSTLTEIGVFVNGSYHSRLQPSAVGSTRHALTLSAGQKTVTFRSAVQAFSSVVLGCWLKSIDANARMTRVSRSQSAGMVIYGDSIAVGQAASPVSTNSWAMLTRDAASYPVVMEAWGSRSLYNDASTSGLIDALVEKFVATDPSKIWLAIGTNDYGLNKWSAASFETAYDDLLVAINAALPACTVYAQTPISRSGETSANGSGSNLPAYRTAIANAASGKSWVTVVDGTAILTTGDLADGIHPTDAGQQLYGAFVIDYLGL